MAGGVSPSFRDHMLSEDCRSWSDLQSSGRNLSGDGCKPDRHKAQALQEKNRKAQRRFRERQKVNPAIDVSEHLALLPFFPRLHGFDYARKVSLALEGDRCKTMIITYVCTFCNILLRNSDDATAVHLFNEFSLDSPCTLGLRAQGP